ncbi:MAG: NUDIX hydrolase [Parcubacteria group bacterium GW2011_GWA2_49_9]|nr:MAG: NUDIX hydrolase [Parcubacteria group bacterium GW2011_GWA2_49_9]
MDLPQCYYRVSVKGLVLDETRTKFLVVQEDNGFWELPGGGLDQGESPQEGLKREIKEEMGLEVTWVADNPSFFLTCKKTKPSIHHWVANVLYEIRLASLAFTPSNECVAVCFVTAEEALALPALPNVYELAKLFGKEKMN